MNPRSFFAAFAAVAIVAGATVTTAAHAQTLNADRGRINSLGDNTSFSGIGYSPTNNVATGASTGTSVTNTFRSYFLFTIAPGVYTSAAFRANSATYQGDATETLDLFDYSGNADSLFTVYSSGSATGQAIYTDLGSGTLYGSVTFSGSNQAVQSTLNASALAAINGIAAAGGGTFIMGGALNEISGDDIIFLSSGATGNNAQPATSYQLVLSTTSSAAPEPGTMALLLLPLGGSAAVFLRRRHKAVIGA